MKTWRWQHVRRIENQAGPEGPALAFAGGKAQADQGEWARVRLALDPGCLSPEAVAKARLAATDCILSKNG